ncbi:MAG: YlxR family protein [Umezawaea sp.]
MADGTLVPDTRHRLPGRGAWLHLDLDCLANAERRRAFPRALRVPGPLAVDHVREHLEQHVKKAAGSSRGEQE